VKVAVLDGSGSAPELVLLVKTVTLGCTFDREYSRGFLLAEANSKAKYKGEKAQEDDEDDEEEGTAATTEVGTIGRDNSVKAPSESRSRRLILEYSWSFFRRRRGLEE